jgi:hypothetical protein
MSGNSSDTKIIERSSAQLRAERAMTDALNRVSPRAAVTRGRVKKIEDNLVSGVHLNQFASDFDKGAGSELKDKFRAPFSSAALMVNTFARFKSIESELHVGRHSGFDSGRLFFEKRCPTGLRGLPPHLDVLVSGAKRALAIESKCTEHLGPKEAYFADSYETLRDDEHQTKPWLDEMMEIRRGRRKYRYLDAAQLIKHAFGLAHSITSRPLALLYLYWEPTNANELAELADHGRELEEFEKRVAGGLPRFQAMTYRQLWTQWAKMDQPAWLRDHVTNLRRRYEVAI